MQERTGRGDIGVLEKKQTLREAVLLAREALLDPAQGPASCERPPCPQ